jgi:hypothetical protein
MYSTTIQSDQVTNTVIAAYLDTHLICAFHTKLECKNYIQEKFPDVDPFDVTMVERWLADYNPDDYVLMNF